MTAYQKGISLWLWTCAALCSYSRFTEDKGPLDWTSARYFFNECGLAEFNLAK